jgi:circadian clock protein KaiB
MLVGCARIGHTQPTLFCRVFVMRYSASPRSETRNSESFKGIALFTPAGDLVYCIDPDKQTRWHLQLCIALQELLGLPEPPHFLVPCYTATVDRWVDAKTQQLQTYAEAGPAVLRYQSLLNAVFETGDVVWRMTPGPAELYDPIMLSNYRSRFPQLWEEHELVMRFKELKLDARSHDTGRSTLSWTPLTAKPESQGYVLRLFVSSTSPATEHILRNLHRLLEQALEQPYTLKVVDIRKHPELAEADQITATPTLVKIWPLPVRRMVGDLDDSNRLLHLLASVDAWGNPQGE